MLLTGAQFKYKNRRLKSKKNEKRRAMLTLKKESWNACIYTRQSRSQRKYGHFIRLLTRHTSKSTKGINQMNYNLKFFWSLTNTWLHEMRKNFRNTPSLWSGAHGEQLFTIQNVLELTVLFLFRVDHVISPFLSFLNF